LIKAKRQFNPEVDDLNWQLLFEKHFQDMQSLNSISSLWISGFSKLGIDNSKRPIAENLTKAIAQYTHMNLCKLMITSYLNKGNGIQ